MPVVCINETVARFLKYAFLNSNGSGHFEIHRTRTLHDDKECHQQEYRWLQRRNYSEFCEFFEMPVSCYNNELNKLKISLADLYRTKQVPTYSRVQIMCNHIHTFESLSYRKKY